MSRSERRDREFRAYVAARSAALHRTAYLLCGDRHLAEDLVQSALTKLYVAWERVRRTTSPDAYAHRVLVNAHIDETRRPWRRERPVQDPDVLGGVDHGYAGPDVGEPELLAGLRRLPARQRTAIVLRHWVDLSVEDTARVMGCTPSTVKTQCARGLSRLRDELTAPLAVPTDIPAPHGGPHRD